MKLYHGTSTGHLGSILKNGIIPRRKKRVSNYTHTIESNPSTVYFSLAYSLYFAMIATEKCKGDLVVFEVDTDKLDVTKLCPDEDVLEQGTRNGGDSLPSNWTMKQRTMYYRRKAHLSEFQYLWLKSLDLMGTCGYYGNVPVSAITKYVVVNPRIQDHLTLMVVDPTITLVNYLILGGKYRALTKWLFNEEPTQEEKENFMNFHGGMWPPSETRDGISIVIL